MKKAYAVIGACLGDEGKGLMVDYLCHQFDSRPITERPIVVRFNGGAQAGHTVVTPEGKRHVFHHFGSGTFAGAQTYLSKHFLVNPAAWIKEARELAIYTRMNSFPHLYIDPGCPITTVYDMFVNQKIEESRTNRHGSCGMGIHETMLRNEGPDHQITYDDLFEDYFDSLLSSIQDYACSRLRFLGLLTEENKNWIMNDRILNTFIQDCGLLKQHSTPRGVKWLKECPEIIFEGAQGLLLDAENKQFFPHVTHSRTGLTNVIEIANSIGIERLDVTYVARSYLTRHGAGPLPGEDPNLKYEDNTNVHNDWQHGLRFAPQDWKLLEKYINKDLFGEGVGYGIRLFPNMAVTHLDQRDESVNIIGIPRFYESYGPTYRDVKCLT